MGDVHWGEKIFPCFIHKLNYFLIQVHRWSHLWQQHCAKVWRRKLQRLHPQEGLQGVQAAGRGPERQGEDRGDGTKIWGRGLGQFWSKAGLEDVGARLTPLKRLFHALYWPLNKYTSNYISLFFQFRLGSLFRRAHMGGVEQAGVFVFPLLHKFGTRGKIWRDTHLVWVAVSCEIRKESQNWLAFAI